MPPPPHLGTRFALLEPLSLFPSVFVMQTGGETEEFDAGEYEIIDIVRDKDGWQDGGSDGYSYCLRAPDRRLGWHCQAVVFDLELPEEEWSEDAESFPYRTDVETRYKVGGARRSIQLFSPGMDSIASKIAP